jgi:hypothetical protein
MNLANVCRHLIHTIELTLGDDSILTLAEEQRQDHFSRVRGILEPLLDDYCRKKGKRRWCEKTPMNLEYVGCLAAVFPEAQYICLYRHGLDTIYSMNEAYQGQNPWISRYLAKHNGNTIAASIEMWCHDAERLLAFELTFPENTYRVSYEQLVMNPEQQLQTMFRFLNVEPSPGITTRAFETAHDDGPGDYKIPTAFGIQTESIGKGLDVDLTGTPEVLRNRMLRLLDALGY